MVDGWMIRPRDVDSTKTYPVLVEVYGAPAAVIGTAGSARSVPRYRNVAIADRGLRRMSGTRASGAG